MVGQHWPVSRLFFSEMRKDAGHTRKVGGGSSARTSTLPSRTLRRPLVSTHPLTQLKFLPPHSTLSARVRSTRLPFSTKASLAS